MAQVHGALSPTWETQRELPAPGFGLAQPWLFWAFGRVNQWMDDLFSLSLLTLQDNSLK